MIIEPDDVPLIPDRTLVETPKTVTLSAILEALICAQSQHPALNESTLQPTPAQLAPWLQHSPGISLASS